MTTHRWAGAAVRTAATAAALVAVYLWLPEHRSAVAGAAARWVAGLAVVVLVLAAQLRAIARSRHPVRKGVQALVLVLTLFVLVFAAAHHLLSAADAGAFTEPLDRLDALYFAVTVLTTVGFGDIAPLTPVARALVTAQMVGDVLVVGGAVRAVVFAVRARHQQVGDHHDG